LFPLGFPKRALEALMPIFDVVVERPGDRVVFHVQESSDFQYVPKGGWMLACFDHRWSDLKRDVAEFSCLSGVLPYGCPPKTGVS
jgi:hypothetical protein